MWAKVAVTSDAGISVGQEFNQGYAVAYAQWHSPADALLLEPQGARKFEGKENEQVMLGRAYGSFARSFTLPEHLDEEHLSAQLADGVLTIRIPKLPQAKPRKVPILSGSERKQLNE